MRARCECPTRFAPLLEISQEAFDARQNNGTSPAQKRKPRCPLHRSSPRSGCAQRRCAAGHRRRAGQGRRARFPSPLPRSPTQAGGGARGCSLTRACRGSGFISYQSSCHNLSMGSGQPQDLHRRQVAALINSRPRWQLQPQRGPVLGRPRQRRLKGQGGPIANPGEMAFTHDLAVDLLTSIP